LFAQGNTAGQATELLNQAAGREARPRLSVARAERLLEEYLAQPIGEKLRLTLMADCVANRMHRLVDDISDLRRIDALIAGADEKTLVSLLDIKRKIKERMAKEYAPGTNDRGGCAGDEADEEIARYYEKILSRKPTQE
jgi:hypothetical protein